MFDLKLLIPRCWEPVQPVAKTAVRDKKKKKILIFFMAVNLLLFPRGIKGKRKSDRNGKGDLSLALLSCCATLAFEKRSEGTVSNINTKFRKDMARLLLKYILNEYLLCLMVNTEGFCLV